MRDSVRRASDVPTAAGRSRALALLLGLLLLAAPAVHAASGTPDAWITAKVKIALFTARDTGALDINVDTYGGRVTLHGKSSTPAEKQHAGELARQVDGVKDVRNLIAVVPKAQRKRAEVADEQVERRVGTVLKRDAALDDSSISVKSVNQGIVVLQGDARSVSDHLRAIEDARSVEGVSRVASEIHSPDKLADNEIWAEDPNNPKTGEGSAWDAWTTAAVKLRLLGSRDIPGLSINVDTQDGVVTLFGAVPSARISQLAEREALKAGGARSVENELQIVAEDRKKTVTARDDEIEKRVSERVDQAQLKDADVKFEVSNGVVRVTGSVPSAQERLEVLTMARSTDGVRSVLDDMTQPKPDERRGEPPRS